MTVQPAPDPTPQPRRAVIDEAWRAIGPGVEMLSGDDGAPLRRTIKRILDPLVLRLRAHPQFSAAVVTPAVAAEMRRRILDHAEQLRCAAAWFEVLKVQRRALRITSGNAQELYFPVCFELAVTRGAPPEDDGDAATAVLRDVHDDRDRTGIEVLRRYVASDQVVAQLSRQLERGWRDVRPGGAVAGPFLAGLSTVLGPANGRARQRVWSALIADPMPYDFGAKAHAEFAELPWSIVTLGLTSVAPQPRPEVTRASEGDLPLNRSVLDRVAATLRRALDRDELPAVPLLCAEEVDRACAPWGLLGEDRQAALVAGIEVAVWLAPLRDDGPGRYELANVVQARLRKEAYVMHARRYLVDGGSIHPRQRHVVDELADFAQPYLRRLWARLHGRDVWQETCDDVDDLRALLEGVARSVSLDHRQRIKSMLESRELEVAR